MTRQHDVDLPALESSLRLTDEFRAILARVGSWRLLRSYDRTVKCSCRNQTQEDQALPACPLCQGAGWPFFEWPVRSYKVVQAVSGNLNAIELPLSFVTMEEDGAIFYLESRLPVSKSDYLFEVALNDQQRIVTPLARLGGYNVVTPVPMRGDRSGAIEFWAVYAVADRGKDKS